VREESVEEGGEKPLMLTMRDSALGFAPQEKGEAIQEGLREPDSERSGGNDLLRLTHFSTPGTW